jgi:hypothetical protein
MLPMLGFGRANPTPHTHTPWSIVRIALFTQQHWACLRADRCLQTFALSTLGTATALRPRRRADSGLTPFRAAPRL